MKNEMALVWTRTMLTVYRYLERICGAIDKMVMKRALNCADITGNNYFQNNVYSVTQRLIDLSDRKVTLINLKVLIEDTLKGISEKDAKILIAKYVDGRKTKELAELFGVSLRTFFRMLKNAEISFCSRLKVEGWTDLKIGYMLKNESWINNVHNQFCTKCCENVVISASYLAKVASM